MLLILALSPRDRASTCVAPRRARTPRGRRAGRASAQPARLSNSTQCLATLTASLSPASTVSDRARVSAAIMSRQVSTSAT